MCFLEAVGDRNEISSLGGNMSRVGGGGCFGSGRWKIRWIIAIEAVWILGVEKHPLDMRTYCMEWPGWTGFGFVCFMSLRC